jgi:hypothetical protein
MDEGHSARAISEIIGVSHDTAARDVRILRPKLIEEPDEKRLARLREEVREEVEKDLRRVAQAAQMLNAALAALGPEEDVARPKARSVSNHKLELVDVLPIGNYAYVTSHFTATLVVNEKATPISGSTVRLLERQSDGQWKMKSHIFVRE